MTEADPADRRLVAVSSLPPSSRALFPFASFNRMQSECFDEAYGSGAAGGCVGNPRRSLLTAHHAPPGVREWRRNCAAELRGAGGAHLEQREDRILAAVCGVALAGGGGARDRVDGDHR